jgi:hypothetical protein
MLILKRCSHRHADEGRHPRLSPLAGWHQQTQAASREVLGRIFTSAKIVSVNVVEFPA